MERRDLRIWLESPHFSLVVAAAVVLSVAAQVVQWTIRPVPDLLGGTIWVVIPLWFIWIPLAAGGWRRIYLMRERVVAFFDARTRNGKRRRPDEGKTMRLAGWMMRHPRRTETIIGAVAICAGLGTVALVHAAGVRPLYPWDVGSATLGFSGALVLGELIAYLIVAVAYYHALRPDPVKDVDHPDEHAGFGVLSEEMNALVVMLFILVLVGNAFFLSFVQTKVLGLTIPGPSHIPFTSEPFPFHWRQVMFALSFLCTGVVLALYVAARLALTEFFERNRRYCVEAWEEAFEAASTPDARSEAKAGLAAAIALKRQPATIGQSIEAGSLAIATLLAFSANLAQLTDTGLTDLLAVFFG